MSTNGHRELDETVTQYIHPDFLKKIRKDVLAKMVEKNTIIELRCYPLSPVCFFKVYHYDLEMAVDEALNHLTMVLN